MTTNNNQPVSLLDTPIEFLKGVGPQRADLFKRELGIFTFGNFVQHYPYRYVDKTRFHQVKDVQNEDEYVQIRGILRQLTLQGEGAKRRLVGIFRDETGYIELVWFKGIQWIHDGLQVGVEYIVFGKPSLFEGKASIVHPDIEVASTINAQTAPTLEPIYYTTDKLRAKRLDPKGLWKLMKTLFERIHPQREQVRETLPAYILDKMGFPGRYDTWLGIHFPRSIEQTKLARQRLKFEELFFIQLRMLQAKTHRKLGIRGLVFDKIGEHFNYFFYNNLKFELTNAQKRVIKEIRRDVGCGQQMNRLLQGDVGSGKTVVGFMSMLMALDNNTQAALMAPTEILAQQHYRSITEMAQGMGLRIELLTGTIKGKARKQLLQDLAEGKVHILVGTHALIEDTVAFKHLGLVVIDEQHRFGVLQRAKLWAKNDTAPPHVLVMTATPIPRTLAMTVYGDLEVSVIDELPPGRKPIKTMHKYEGQRLAVFGMMRREIEIGRQVYVVYPLIDESEHETMADIKNLMQGYEALEREFPKPQYQISIVHGKQKPDDKEYEMQRFIKGETQIMIATTVIEVGVNVPNASVMVIENAERFGLAQLHQLRGRVGRGADQSYCILLTGFKLSSEGRFRMQTMVETTDGFKISEADLQLRGPGNIEGTQQSGVLNLKLADLVKDADILRTARIIASEILDEDPHLQKPENEPLAWYLEVSKKTHGFGRIS